ncbi:hypothetical protein MLD38_002068 [Melastoma candidum]|uniref:Uncharacterized protein n=1 Tax=Melastoma candidum TaxID=119954 RepID=A0ACB9SK70_9MYRT|nr:hypothetical protein MLD38_002068 [Melastoma candidum]
MNMAAGGGGYGTWKRNASKEVLKHFDGNDDGSLSLYELTAAYKKMGVKSPVRHAYTTLLSVDEDGDGNISKEREVAAVGTYLRVLASHRDKAEGSVVKRCSL